LSSLVARTLGLLSLVAAVGCASEPMTEGMVVSQLESGRRHPYSVRLDTTGLAECCRRNRWIPLTYATVLANGDFREALVASIDRSRLFTEVVADGGADFLLDVFVHVTDPDVGAFEPLVSVEAKWTLRESSSGRTRFERIVRTSHRSALRDAFSANMRRMMAYDGAVQANIAEGMRQISELDLDQPAQPDRAELP
jgi:hypothetical protein